MITPRFTIKQDESFVIVILHVPYIKISNSQFFIEGTEFKFYIKPYYLRLNFSQEIEENGKEKATYNVDKGDVTVYVPKKNEGEYFEDLEITSKLLAPKEPKVNTGLIEDLTEESDDEVEWNWEQEVPKEPEFSGIKYGFNNRHSQFYGRFLSEYPDLLCNKQPEESTNLERRQQVISQVIETFDMEHYLCDFLEGKELPPVFIPLYRKSDDWIKNLNELILQFPRQQLLINNSDVPRCLYGIADILFAFAYDHIINEGEDSPESCWNICRLSSQLSWLYNPESIQDTVYLNFLQALTFPLYRNFGFCKLVMDEVKYIVLKGKPLIYQCLLKVYSLFLKHEFYHLHNTTFIKDYILFVQQLRPNHIEQLHLALQTVDMKKTDLPLPLDEFEGYCNDNISSSETETESEMYSDEDSTDDENSNDDEDSDDILNEAKVLRVYENDLSSRMASLTVGNPTTQPLIVEI